MESKRIEGLWDCAYCGNTGIKARYGECQQCGSPRGPETRFYLPDDLQGAVLTKEEAAKTTNEPDWMCSYCSTYNRSDATVCKGCGALKKEADGNYGTRHKLTGFSFWKK
ncbi:MAG: zinc finger Ran-binding domain-containing protein [Lachnospiraceae bacterium]|nr:zinc finger Ran-binding domain-containing protein [Lachnospiraceae bacterium]